MRVTWVALEWPREGHHSGGVGRYLARLAEQMKDLVDLTVITYEGADPIDGVEFLTIPAPEGRLERYYTSAWRAARLVRRTRPDVIHAHGDDFLIPKAAPIVRSFYGTSLGEARSSTGLRKANHYVLAGAEWISMKRSALKLGIAPESVEQFDCDRIVPPYLRQANDLTRRPTAQPSIVFIGSHQGRKRGWLLEEAAAGLRDKFPGLTLTVVGPAVDASSWQPWVDHRAGLTDAEVSDLLSSSWVLVSPSSYEGFGIPLLEGLDHGARVVASINPGSRYLADQASLHTPLRVVADERLAWGIEEALRAGPAMTRDEDRAAEGLVRDLASAGSPAALVTMYETAAGS